ncbi:hypothetical protein F5878DRAFT_727281 [Lentinula raphanica]|uniref:Uncharacterized protein n=1 Tax=Lentinula raphanica TaxID=153919 RepID=A0AA38UAZ5_9AGAR|nr:hypothetical protein F5880DRAFT_1511655 [Lentinula raphanica]KAJ3835771.1 hypothetical protein F5878DRAFT_727281 [Lentinula raphanica]
MVRVPAARMVILSLSLLQMGLFTSVLAAPTPAAVVPVHPEEHSKATGPVASSSKDASRPFRCPAAAPSARVQKRLTSQNERYSEAENEFLAQFECQSKDRPQPDFNHVMTWSDDKFKTLVGILRKKVEDPNWNTTKDVRTRGLQRISKWQRAPDERVSKEGVVWWFFFMVLNKDCWKDPSSGFTCLEGSDMYPDRLALEAAEKEAEGMSELIK